MFLRYMKTKLLVFVKNVQSAKLNWLTGLARKR